MATQARVYTVDDVWQLDQQPMNIGEKYYLIDGELFAAMSPGELHGELATRIAFHLFTFVEAKNLGRVTVETGYHPRGSQRTLLIPDIAFVSKARASQPPLEGFVPRMPDLAVEILSPSQPLATGRRKAKVYLRHDTAMVWLIHPQEQSADVWIAAKDGSPQRETIDVDAALSGGTVLPGFKLPLRKLFLNK